MILRTIRLKFDRHFNPALIQWQGRLLLASRKGWGNALVCLSELDSDYRVLRTYAPLMLAHKDQGRQRARSGREDPRLFVHDGALHVAYTGYERREPEPCHQMFARLSDDLKTVAVTYPHYAGRNPWEKNWGFFSHAGDLHAVYSVEPHIVLRIDGTHATEVERTSSGLTWSHGHLRGGASPVRVGDEFYSFFHGMRETPHGRLYSVGVYTFEAHAPFKITRFTPKPILLPGGARGVVFPCGAVRLRDRWAVSYGYQDRECRVTEFAVETIEQALKPVGEMADEFAELCPCAGVR